MYDDSKFIQLMVDLRESDSSLDISGAAALAIRGARLSEGEKRKAIERLRKKYRKLRDEGRLPAPRAAAEIERRSNQIREGYRRNEAAREKARQELVVAEREAAAMGVLPDADLAAVIQDLERQKESLNPLTRDPVDWLVSHLAQQGLDQEAAVARYQQAAREQQELEVRIEFLRNLRTLRTVAALPL